MGLAFDMFTWLAFINMLFWVTFFSFLFTTANLFSLILLSELVWVSLYTLAGVVGSTIDDAGCFSITFFVLGLASIELCFGLLLLLLMRHLKVSMSLQKNTKTLGSKFFNSMAVGAYPKKRV